MKRFLVFAILFAPVTAFAHHLDAYDRKIRKAANLPLAWFACKTDKDCDLVSVPCKSDIAVNGSHKDEAYKGGEIHTWTEAQISQFETHWSLGSKQRLAFALHLYTGQRRSDVHRMTWADYDGEGILVTQQKTGAKLDIPVHPELKSILDAAPNSGDTILVTEYGRSFTVAGYGSWINGAIRAAGLPAECVAHGLRKAAARRMAEAGCTPHEVAAITGHKTLGEVERYARAVDQRRMSRAALEKQWRNKID
jgi:integrase